jgi:transcription elongation factor GreA
MPFRKPGKYSEVNADPLLTKEKFFSLQKKLERLKQTHPHAAAEVKHLAELGDFSENAEYQLAKGRLRGINNNILKLEQQIARAEFITPPKQTDTVQIGHTVTVAVGDRKKTYQILGSLETDPARGIISHNSPIGAALVGRKVGETVEVRIAGKTVSYRIVRVI